MFMCGSCACMCLCAYMCVFLRVLMYLRLCVCLYMRWCVCIVCAHVYVYMCVVVCMFISEHMTVSHMKVPFQLHSPLNFLVQNLFIADELVISNELMLH